MHFTQIFATIIALPVLAMAAAIPEAQPVALPAAEFGTSDLMVRAVGDPCSKFTTVAAGRYAITNNLKSDVVMYRVSGGILVDSKFETITPGATKITRINSNEDAAQYKLCTKVAGNAATSCITLASSKTFTNRADGDRWNIILDISPNLDSWVQSSCTIGEKI